MNDHDYTRLLIRVAAIQPTLTGGNRAVQTQRRETVLDALGPTTTLDDALEALRNLIRNGTSANQLTWSLIVAETLAITRRRIDAQRTTDAPTGTDHGRPADFVAVVAWHRDRVRREAHARTCPQCDAPPDQPCAGAPPVHPTHGMHNRRLDHGTPTITDLDRRIPRGRANR